MLFNYSTYFYNYTRSIQLTSLLWLVFCRCFEKNCTLHCNVIYYILSSNFMSVIFSQPAEMPAAWTPISARVKLWTVGSRAFPVVSAQIWTTCRSMWRMLSCWLHFAGGSKTHLFVKSFLAVTWILTNLPLLRWPLLEMWLTTWLIDWQRNVYK